jgi:demethylmenaquinone methyltransferase/2-methoxy-6-polyprenyl-1,4-benzoquinol methylase
MDLVHLPHILSVLGESYVKAMSSYVLMRLLESMPDRYDQGLRLLTAGSLARTYDRLVSHISGGMRVLDLGCGTGALTLRAAARGATVKGIDINPQMLEVARQRAEQRGLSTQITWREMGVAELGAEPAKSYDVVMSGLCFSELTADEVVYTLKESYRLLKPSGLLLVADEVEPRRWFKRVPVWFVRLWLKFFTYLLTQKTTTALKQLPARVTHTGFRIESIKYHGLDSFVELVGRKTVEDSK